MRGAMLHCITFDLSVRLHLSVSSYHFNHPRLSHRRVTHRSSHSRLKESSSPCWFEFDSVVRSLFSDARYPTQPSPHTSESFSVFRFSVCSGRSVSALSSRQCAASYVEIQFTFEASITLPLPEADYQSRVGCAIPLPAVARSLCGPVHASHLLGRSRSRLTYALEHSYVRDLPGKVLIRLRKVFQGSSLNDLGKYSAACFYSSGWLATTPTGGPFARSLSER